MLPRNKFKEVYRILAKEFHPDRNPSPEAKEKFKLVNEIYCVLSDQAGSARVSRDLWGYTFRILEFQVSEKFY
jgi:molecular chaperone DnaJ